MTKDPNRRKTAGQTRNRSQERSPPQRIPIRPRRVLIRYADLVPGWALITPLPFKLCGSDPFREAVRIAEAHHSYGMADLQQMVGSFASRAAARRAYGELASGRGIHCFRKEVEAEVKDYSGGQMLKPLKVLQREPLGSMGQARPTRLEVVDSPIGPVNVYTDVAHAQAGRTMTFLKISCGIEPLREMAHLVAQRVGSATGT